MRRRTALTAPAAVVAALAVAALTASASPSHAGVRAEGAAAATTITVWADNVQKPAIDRIASAWGRTRDVNVVVVVKPFGQIRDDLKQVRPENAPDAIVGPHDWVGDLAANGLIQRLLPRRTTRAQFPADALQAFSYNGRLYGAPYAKENVGLVVNTRIAKVPKSFADLERQALRIKRKTGIAIAVPQGAGGDAYHMYPFFSGLCGYVFGRTKSGALNPRDVGVANRRFLRNATVIERWNRSGFVNSRIDYGNAKDAFLKGRAGFWITGPWETKALKESGLRYRIVPFPKLRCRSTPFLGVQGLMVTRYAATHGVASLTTDLVARYMMTPGAQTLLAAANERFPANKLAGRRVTDPVLKQFGRAGAVSVPMPNIPQMGAVWSELGGAWVKATRGPGATRARPAFSTAARNIRAKIASG